MTITRYDPATIFLGGDHTQIGDLAASEAITPGMLVERVTTGNVVRWRKHATAAVATARLVALNHSMVNKGVDDDYAINDLMEVSAGHGGTTYWMLIASGQTIVAGDKLESAGNGTLRKLAAGVPLFSALEAKTALALTRLRVEVV